MDGRRPRCANADIRILEVFLPRNGVRVDNSTEGLLRRSRRHRVDRVRRPQGDRVPEKGHCVPQPRRTGRLGNAPRCSTVRRHHRARLGLVGFDPRGINMTTPRVACFRSMADANLFSANTILEKGLTVSSSNISDRAPARRSKASSSCKHGNTSPSWARGMRRGHGRRPQEFDGKGAKINYWGASYGTIIGAYLVNMLPDRVGRVVIDGMVDPVGWANQPSHKWAFGDLSSTEKTYTYYLQKCTEAGPSRCPIAKSQNEPPSDISARIEAFLDALAVSPLPVIGNGVARTGILTSGSARRLLLTSLVRIRIGFRPKQTSTRATLRPRASSRSCLDSPPPFEDAERSPPPSAEDLAAEFLRTMDHVSSHFGASVSVGEPDGGCHFWPTSGKGPERFTGPWNASLEVPMLIVSNTMDPITPIQSGLLINSLMPHSSRMIIQDGPGHCSTAIATPCTQKLVRDYYAGVVPANGTMCGMEYEFFPGKTVNMQVQVLSDEDARVAESARVVGELLYKIGHGVVTDALFVHFSILLRARSQHLTLLKNPPNPSRIYVSASPSYCSMNPAGSAHRQDSDSASPADFPLWIGGIIHGTRDSTPDVLFVVSAAMHHSPVIIPCTDPHCTRTDKLPLPSSTGGPRSILCAPCAAARGIHRDMDTYDYSLSGQCPECGLRFLPGAEARAMGLEGAIQAWPPRAELLPTVGSATSSFSQAAGLHSEEPFRLLPAPLPASTATSNSEPCPCQACSYSSRYPPPPSYAIPAPVLRAAPVLYLPRPSIAAFPQPEPKEEYIHGSHCTPSPSPPPAPTSSFQDGRVAIHLEERADESVVKPKLTSAADTVPHYTPMVFQPVQPAERVGVVSSPAPAPARRAARKALCKVLDGERAERRGVECRNGGSRANVGEAATLGYEGRELLDRVVKCEEGRAVGSQDCAHPGGLVLREETANSQARASSSKDSLHMNGIDSIE
uniref:Peptidase S33 tripeptidyl aminopeptidase-like C-terminal domain-containing protein n=1 Tax=Mycena chlorophos TaxID=658473 RepID=A0ABQ0L458_MYCCL|nr:predicted protein [Mycena chlorophos]